MVAVVLPAGELLAARIARVGPLPREQAARIMDAMAKAIQTVHDAGLVHGGLESRNVFLEQRPGEERVKLLERGPVEAPPGAVDGPLGPQLDLWALALIGFELCTGADPFPGARLPEKLERLTRDPLPKASPLAPHLPVDVDAFFALAFSRVPNERIASARELTDRYRAALAGLPPPPRQAYDSTRPAGRARRKGGPSHRLRRDLVIGVVVVVLGAAFSLVASRHTRDARSHAAPAVPCHSCR